LLSLAVLQAGKFADARLAAQIRELSQRAVERVRADTAGRELADSRFDALVSGTGLAAADAPTPSGARTAEENAERRADASAETRCGHCFITFATPSELREHASRHCFPHDPSEVLRRFPAGAEAIDTTIDERLVIVGAASNPHKVHSMVSSRYLRRGIVADVPISRLRLVEEGVE